MCVRKKEAQLSKSTDTRFTKKKKINNQNPTAVHSQYCNNETTILMLFHRWGLFTIFPSFLCSWRRQICLEGLFAKLREFGKQADFCGKNLICLEISFDFFFFLQHVKWTKEFSFVYKETYIYHMGVFFVRLELSPSCEPNLN